jgi:hypothetical protein
MTNFTPILTASVGDNADLLAKILQLYVAKGSVVADVTFGKGVFWNNIDTSKYKLLKSDLKDGIDFKCLPYESSSIDCEIIDPPYMHGGKTIKKSINDCYQNNNDSHESVIRLYASGILEAARVLKKNGVLIVKSQDETESGKQRLSHCEIINLLEILGFKIVDLFVLVQKSIPAMRETYQKSARKNHSYAIVAKFRR